jgi:hypothetical protein
MQIEQGLIRESQLDVALNTCVHQGRRGDFGMMLAMLSQDALDFAQFHLPTSVAEEKNRTEEVLKRELQIGPQKPLAPSEFDMLIGQENAFVVQHFGMTALHLKECLVPEPLAVRDDKKHIPLEVIDNCELAVRRKLKPTPHISNNKMIDAAGFYDQLASGRAQSLLNAVA